MAHDDATQIKKNATEARAGVTGHHVRYVLLAGLVLVIAAFAILWAILGS